MTSKTVNEIVYGLFILDYQRRLDDIRLIEGEEYTSSYTKFVEDVAKFCMNNGMKFDDVMMDIELK